VASGTAPFNLLILLNLLNLFAHTSSAPLYPYTIAALSSGMALRTGAEEPVHQVHGARQYWRRILDVRQGLADIAIHVSYPPPRHPPPGTSSSQVSHLPATARNHLPRHLKPRHVIREGTEEPMHQVHGARQYGRRFIDVGRTWQYIACHIIQTEGSILPAASSKTFVRMAIL